MPPGKRLKMEQYNKQMIRRQKRSQRDAVGKALQHVMLALDDVRDCQACGSECVEQWLEPAAFRLVFVKNLLSDALREGGEL